MQGDAKSASESFKALLKEANKPSPAFFWDNQKQANADDSSEAKNARFKTLEDEARAHAKFDLKDFMERLNMPDHSNVGSAGDVVMNGAHMQSKTHKFSGNKYHVSNSEIKASESITFSGPNGRGFTEFKCESTTISAPDIYLKHSSQFDTHSLSEHGCKLVGNVHYEVVG